MTAQPINHLRLGDPVAILATDRNPRRPLVYRLHGVGVLEAIERGKYVVNLDGERLLFLATGQPTRRVLQSRLIAARPATTEEAEAHALRRARESTAADLRRLATHLLDVSSALCDHRRGEGLGYDMGSSEAVLTLSLRSWSVADAGEP